MEKPSEAPGSGPQLLKVCSTFTKPTTYTLVQETVEVGRKEKLESLLHFVCRQSSDEHDEEQQVGKWNGHVKHLHINKKKAKENRLISLDRQTDR